MTLHRRSTSPPLFRDRPARKIFQCGRSESCTLTLTPLPLTVPLIEGAMSLSGASSLGGSKRRNELSSSVVSKATFVTFLIVICGVGLYAKYSSIQQRLDFLASERDELSEAHASAVREMEQLTRKAKRVETDNAKILRMNEKLEERKEELKLENEKITLELTTEKKARMELEKEMRMLATDDNYNMALDTKDAIKGMKAAIQKQSRREVLDKFGPGPYRVEFELEIPEGKDSSIVQYMVIEMAPLSLMPHAVNIFLQQVTRKIWDGTEIFRNRPHILMARALDHKSREDRMKELRGAMIDKLSFREHSDDFPHKQYTLGFAGNPGGPNFYFNKLDNTVDHGPGPQNGDEGDACFAIIVNGEGLIGKISSLPTNSDMTLKRPVVIKSAFVLKHKDGKWYEH